MTLEINLGNKREKRLMKHLKIEHPSVRGNIKVRKCNKKTIYKIISSIPNFEEQARMFTQIKLKGGKK